MKPSTEIKFFKQTLTDTQTMSNQTTEANFVFNQIYLKCWMIELPPPNWNSLDSYFEIFAYEDKSRSDVAQSTTA